MPLLHLLYLYYRGEREIRTHGPLSRSPVFKTGAISQTLPALLILSDISDITSVYPKIISDICPIKCPIYCTDSRIRTYTGITAHLLLRQACLPIPPYRHEPGHSVQIFVHVPPEGVEPSKAKFLKLLAVPIYISHRGIKKPSVFRGGLVILLYLQDFKSLLRHYNTHPHLLY